MTDATTRARSSSSTSRDAAHLIPPVTGAPAGATTSRAASTPRVPEIDRYAGICPETITTERPPWYFQWAREWKRAPSNASGVERGCV